MSGVLCNVRRANGYLCINPAATPAGTCKSHAPENQCIALTSRGKRCRRMKSFGTDRCSKHQS
jgi:hypothetical protein